jgi:DNA polymerase I
MSEKKRLVVIDGNSVFYRGYYAMPNLSTADGTPTGGVFGFAAMSLELMKRLKPDYVVVAWDKPKTNIRKRLEIYPQYKAGRKAPPPDFYEQIPVLHNLLDAFGWPLVELDDYEADDILAGLAKQAEAKGVETLLITSDLDLLQCVSELTHIYALKSGLTNIEKFSVEHFVSKYDLQPEQFIDLKALKGDSSDNIPGVPGVGEKGASVLLREYKTLDGVYENIDKITGATQKKLIAGEESARMSKRLVTLMTDIPYTLDLEASSIERLDPGVLKATLLKLEFRSLLRNLPDFMKDAPVAGIPSGSVASELGQGVSMIDSFAVRIERASFTPDSKKPVLIHGRAKGAHGSNPTAFLVSQDEKNYVVLSPKELRAVWQILARSPFWGYDTKSTIKMLKELNLETTIPEHDVHVCQFILNSLTRLTGLDQLAEQYNVISTGLDELTDEDFEARAGELVTLFWTARKAQHEEFSKLPTLKKLADEIELPGLPVLADMEREGIHLDVLYFSKLRKELEDSLEHIRQDIYGHAGKEFNIASPSQLADILFDTLQLPSKFVKKGKTGFSTAANELDRLRDLHPIIDCVTQFREINKLLNTYVVTLPEQVAADGRVHTTFNVTVAQTGRLSSVDPNLQNIPVRTELGNKIRTGFVAQPGYVFVSADYSQFELRLAAVLADDKELIKLFNTGLDVHTETAARVHNILPMEVTKQQRSAAKVINFGVLYGMSPHGLSIATGMTIAESKAFIDGYFNLRKPILSYMQSIKEFAREKGYVETLFGRRRLMPDIHSSNFVVRQAAERAAINMPIQGTEADLMKIAMIDLAKVLPKEAKMLLQIHDSILVECPEGLATEVSKIMKLRMEHVHKLPVKLDVEVHTAANWGSL